MPSDRGGAVTGCVLVDKPAGMTSHDVVAKVRRSLGIRKVGHGGTLDPDATGVLVVALGPATRLLRFVSDFDKAYTAEVVFGTTTTTLDATGEVLDTFEMEVDDDALREIAQDFVGTIEQVPPMVSALKVNGQRLHVLARQGIEVERAPRKVEIFSIELEATSDPLVYRLAVSCSSGTYVRTLAADLGSALGGGAHLRHLRRVRVGPFAATELCALDDVDADAVRPALDLVHHLGTVVVDDVLGERVRHGSPLRAEEIGGFGERSCVVSSAGELLAVYRREGDLARPIVVLSSPAP